MMPSGEVRRVLDALESGDVRAWVEGRWEIDALGGVGLWIDTTDVNASRPSTRSWSNWMMP